MTNTFRGVWTGRIPMLLSERVVFGELDRVVSTTSDERSGMLPGERFVMVSTDVFNSGLFCEVRRAPADDTTLPIICFRCRFRKD